MITLNFTCMRRSNAPAMIQLALDYNVLTCLPERI